MKQRVKKLKKIKRGKFIVLEGTDGSGKGEQFKLLTEALRARRIKFQTVDFPQHGKKSAYFVDKYLKGAYDSWTGSHAELSSIFYAIDRFDVSLKIHTWLDKGIHVLGNRYVASSMGHQGAKIKNARERERFIRWVHDLEYAFFGIPKPDLNVFLKVPPEVAYHLISKKKSRTLRGKKRDIHEASVEHLRRVARSYAETVKLFPREFHVIECAPRGALRAIPEIHKDMLGLVLNYVGFTNNTARG